MTTPAFPAAHWRKSSYSDSTANCVEVAFLDWRKSSYSDSGANCVEVARADGRVGVRDSKRPGPSLVVPAASWIALLATIRGTH